MRLTGILILSWLVALGVAAADVQAADPVNADLLLTGGTLHDGTGGPGAVGDVAMAGGEDRRRWRFQSAR